MGKYHKLEFYVPTGHADAVIAAVCAAGGGRVGDYDSCCWRTEGEGRFRPLLGAEPFVGSIGILESVPETKVEILCPGGEMSAIIAALRTAHPYETPAFQHWPVAVD